MMIAHLIVIYKGYCYPYYCFCCCCHFDTPYHKALPPFFCSRECLNNNNNNQQSSGGESTEVPAEIGRRNVTADFGCAVSGNSPCDDGRRRRTGSLDLPFRLRLDRLTGFGCSTYVLLHYAALCNQDLVRISLHWFVESRN